MTHARLHTEQAESRSAQEAPTSGATPHTIRDQVEELLTVAQPRLAQLARTQRVAPDAIDDVVQETLLEVWRHLDHLRSPERFERWVNGICRNVCRRWVRAHGTIERWQTSLSAAQLGETDQPEALVEVPDPLAADPVEALNRQDLAVLLDRALGYLPASARQAVEWCYLSEVPPGEAAARLGLTPNALEVRLHRARRQLRQVLQGALRADAEAFGLVLDQAEGSGWRETSIWCYICGRQRLLGLFEPLPSGNVNLRLRCPACSPPAKIDIATSAGYVPFERFTRFVLG